MGGAEPGAERRKTERRRRLFVGIALDEATRGALVRVAKALEHAGLGGRFELPEKLHVTLAFLGSVDPARVDPLIAALRTAIAPLPAFTARFDCVGAFPNERRAKIAWAGTRKSDEAFERLTGAVRGAAREFARLDEKPAVFHVTLARLKEPERLPHVAQPNCSMPVSAIVLFESLQAETTSRYEVVERFTLQTFSPSGSR